MDTNAQFENLAKGLVLHFLLGRTVDDAVLAGRRVGMPEELLDFPAMMFQATSAAGAVYSGERTLSEVLDSLADQGAPRDGAEALVNLALATISDLEAQGGPDQPVPASEKEWFEYEGLPTQPRKTGPIQKTTTVKASTAPTSASSKGAKPRSRSTTKSGRTTA